MEYLGELYGKVGNREKSQQLFDAAFSSMTQWGLTIKDDEEISEYQYALWRLCNAEIQSGYFQGARAVVNTINHPMYRFQFHLRIAQGFIDAGNFKEAHQSLLTAEGIEGADPTDFLGAPGDNELSLALKYQQLAQLTDKLYNPKS